MGVETLAAIGSYFSGTSATAAALTATESVAAAYGIPAAAAAELYGGVTAGQLATAGVAGAAAGAGTSTLLGKSAEIVGTAAATGLVSKALAPKAPGLPTPLPMPDPLAQQEARKRALFEQMTRSGRTSTMLTAAADRLG